MKKLFSVLFTCFLLILYSCNDSAERMDTVPNTKTDIASLSGQQVQPGKLIVKFKQEPSSTDVLTRAAGIEVRKMERIFPPAGKFEARSRAAGLHLWYVIEYDEKIAATRVAEGLSFLDDVLVIEPIIPVKKVTDGAFMQLSEADLAELKSTTTRSGSTDPYLYLQWNYENTGKINHAVMGADIRLFDAWEISMGSPEVIVAVVDGGIDYTHEDLAGNIWINEAENGSVENHDDDGNGYKDDIYGYNFVTGKAIEPTLHGTHVAGIIGAVNNNGIGVGGIAGGNGSVNSGVRLMSCQIFTDDESGEKSATNYYTAAAIKYGADNGAVISQNSWGFDFGTVAATPTIIKEAIDYFIANAGADENGNQVGPMKGGLVVFAAGNDNVMTPTFPASDDNVISVAAMGPDYKRATYTNYGTTIDITAPGGEMSYDPNRARTSILSTGAGWDGNYMVKNAYYYMDGTSMSCPHISGVAALVISAYGVEQPGFTSAILKERLLNSVYDISAYNSKYQGMLGVGALDASKALNFNTTLPKPPVLLKSIPNYAFNKIGNSKTLVLSDYFASTEGVGSLTYNIAVSAEGVVDLQLTTGVLLITTTGYGKTSITVTASSDELLQVGASFLVSCYSRTTKPNEDKDGFWVNVGDGVIAQDN